MEKFNQEDYKVLIDLVEKEKELIHKEAIHDKDLRAKEIDLDFIKIKLETQSKMLQDSKKW